MILGELREEIVFYGKQMLAGGLTMNTGGNLSARCHKTGLIAIKPSSIHYEKLTAKDITVIDIDGKIIDGEYRPSSEWRMHTMIYRAYPRVRAVVHCHSVYATAMGVAGERVPLINHELCVYCTSPIRVQPFALPGTDALGQSAIDGFGTDNNVTILQNHGAIAIGASLWHAYDAACSAEQAAHGFFIAKTMGKVNVLPVEGRKYLRNSDPLMSRDMGEVKINAV